MASTTHPFSHRHRCRSPWGAARSFGAQLARTQADLVLLSENLAHLARGVAVARRALRVIRQNLLWSLAYNLIALPLAMAGQVTPWMAGIGMSASSLLVVANSLRLHQPARS